MNHSLQPGLRTTILLLAFLFVIGAALRIYPSALYQKIGFDEQLYCGYVDEMVDVGLFRFPEIAAGYIEKQKALPSAILPPTRFTYVFSGYIWRSTFGGDSPHALHAVSCLFSILTMALGTAFAWRLGGQKPALLTAALLTVAPLEIHMAQHGMIDGFFAFWALSAVWLLWENLQQPRSKKLLAAYTFVIAVMVATKENAFFVYLGLWLILLVNWKLRFGTATRALYLGTLGGAVVGAGTLLLLAGGMDQLFEIYLLLTRKAYALPFAIQYCDGPWQRFLVDLLLVSPVVTLLAVGTVFQPKTLTRPALFLLVFVLATYTLITSVKYGINLRYAVMWDMPLRFLAATSLLTLQEQWKIKTPWLILSVLAICTLELRQYYILFVEHNLYELVSAHLLEILKFIKK